MIFRIKKHDHGYVIIDGKLLNDAALSLRAKGLLAWFLSKPDNWVVVMSDLKARHKDGRYSVQAAFQELRDHGHATLEVVRDEKGRILGKEWHIHEQAKRIRPLHVRGPLEEKAA
jgi:hypothetical protein